MNSSAFWYGYLEAGKKGSLVVRDNSLDTGKPDTFYLYNHKRDAILEYKASFVEPKLRDLNDGELELIPELKKAFNASRKQFQSSTGDPLNTAAAPVVESKSGKPDNVLDELKIDDTPEAADDDFILDETE